MKKKLAIGILSVAILAGGAGSVMGAIDSTKTTELKDLYQQMFTIQKQIVDKEAEAGIVTEQEATSVKGSIDQRAERNTEAIDSGDVYGYGQGSCYGAGGGYARGNGNGTGRGGGFCGGWNQGTNAPNPTSFSNN